MGRLAEGVLTTGAVTAVLDRLKRAGYVRRLADPSDWPAFHIGAKETADLPQPP